MAAAAGAGQETLQVAPVRLQGIDAEGRQAVEDVQLGAAGPDTGGEREVAGEVGEAQLEGGDQPAGLGRRQPVDLSEKKAAGGPRSKRTLLPQGRGWIVEWIECLVVGRDDLILARESDSYQAALV